MFMNGKWDLNPFCYIFHFWGKFSLYIEFYKWKKFRVSLLYAISTLIKIGKWKTGVYLCITSYSKAKMKYQWQSEQILFLEMERKTLSSKTFFLPSSRHFVVPLRLSFANHPRHSSIFSLCDVTRQTLNDIESIWREENDEKLHKMLKLSKGWTSSPILMADFGSINH